MPSFCGVQEPAGSRADCRSSNLNRLVWPSRDCSVAVAKRASRVAPPDARCSSKTREGSSLHALTIAQKRHSWRWPPARGASARSARGRLRVAGQVRRQATAANRCHVLACRQRRIGGGGLSQLDRLE